MIKTRPPTFAIVFLYYGYEAEDTESKEEEEDKETGILLPG